MQACLEQHRARQSNHPKKLAIATGFPDFADWVAASTIASAATRSASVTGRAEPALIAVAKAAYSAA
jgi:hypothetical protein